MSKRANIPVKNIVTVVVSLVVAPVLYLLLMRAGLQDVAARCLAILGWAIVWWVGGILPEFATGLIMVIGFYLIAGVDTSISFHAFTASTWWLLVAAFSLGAGMKACGLLRRMAIGIIRAFPKNFAAQVTGIMAAGTLLGPLIPSMAVKASILAPISMSMGETLGYKHQDKQMQGMFAAVLVGVRTVGPAVISASVIGYTIWGLMPSDVQASFDMAHWFIAALPWFVPCLVLSLISIIVLYGPRSSRSSRPRDVQDVRQGEDVRSVSAPSVDTQSANARAESEAGESFVAVGSVNLEEPEGAADGAGAKKPAVVDVTQEDLGPLSRQEKQMLVIIVCAVALWVTESIHGIAAHVVALAALVAMVACGIMDRKSFRSDVSWDSLVFIGIAIGLASVFQEVGIQDWVVEVAGPMFGQLAGNPYLFVFAIAAFTLVVRFVIVSQMAYANIVLVFLVPLAVSAGINPWVVGMAIYVAIDPWFLIYQNPVYLALYYSVDGEMARHADMAKYCVVYTAICFIALLIAVPFWQMMGLF